MSLILCFIFVSIKQLTC